MENTKQIESFSAEDTHALGKKLGEKAKPGDVLYTAWGSPEWERQSSHRGLPMDLG